MGCRVWQLVFTSPLLHHRHTLHIDLLILKSFLRYLLTPYLVVIWACNGIRAKKMTDPLVNLNYYKTDLKIKLNRRFLRRSRTTCWRSWSSRGAPSWSGWSWSSGGCSGATLLGIQAWNTPWGYKYAIGAKLSCNFLLTHIFVILIWWSSHIIIRDAKRSQYAPAWCWETQKIFNLGGVVIVVLQSFCVAGVVLWCLEMCIICSMWRLGVYLVSQTHLPFTF